MPLQAQPRALPTCTPWQTCREQALEAAGRGDREAFHDLAWRTVQIGPAGDPDLLWILARAQAASGRAHDALVLVRRLTERGVATSADRDPDFALTRELPDWPAVEAQLSRLRREGVTATAVDAPAAPKPSKPSLPESQPSRAVDPQPVTRRGPDAAREGAAAATAATAGTVAPAATVARAPARDRRTEPAALLTARVRGEAVAFSTSPFRAGGLAYDAVSRRFVIGDTEGRRVFVVGLDTRRAVDMVRAESARFHDVVDVGIDQSRGDLWVSSRDADGHGALHRLQLVSGRPLRIYQPPRDAGPVSLGDLAVGRAGAVIVLDTLGRRIWAPPSAGLDLRLVARLQVEPTSLAASSTAPLAYVAHQDGIVRVELTTGSTREIVPSALGVTAGFERIRTYRDGLVGVQRTADDRRRLVFLPLRRGGRAVGVPMALDVTLPSDAPAPVLTVLDDEISYLVPGTAAANPSDASPADASPSVIHRIRLN